MERGGDTGEFSNESRIVSGKTNESTDRSTIEEGRGVTNSLDIFLVGFETVSGDYKSNNLHQIDTKGAVVHAELQLRLMKQLEEYL